MVKIDCLFYFVYEQDGTEQPLFGWEQAGSIFYFYFILFFCIILDLNSPSLLKAVTQGSSKGLVFLVPLMPF